MRHDSGQHTTTISFYFTIEAKYQREQLTTHSTKRMKMRRQAKVNEHKKGVISNTHSHKHTRSTK